MGRKEPTYEISYRAITVPNTCHACGRIEKINRFGSVENTGLYIRICDPCLQQLIPLRTIAKLEGK